MARLRLCSIAADKFTLQATSGMQYAKPSRRRIDHQIAGHCDGADQPLDQTDRLRMRMNPAVDLLNPPAWNAVVAPVARGHWRRCSTSR